MRQFNNSQLPLCVTLKNKQTNKQTNTQKNKHFSCSSLVMSALVLAKCLMSSCVPRFDETCFSEILLANSSVLIAEFYFDIIGSSLYLTHPRRATARSLRGLRVRLEREIMKQVSTSIKFRFFISSFSFLFQSCRCLIFRSTQV